MDDIDSARQAIDAADRKMAELFCERMKAVQKIARYKQEKGLPIFDKKREATVLNKNTGYVDDPALSSYYVSFLHSVMDISKRYQQSMMEGMHIAFCGVEGAYANIAAAKIFPTGQLVPYDDFKSAYKAVENGLCECCVLPIENSTAGEVGTVIDLMYSGSLYVNGVYSLPIKHHLLGLKHAHRADIRKVISHPQALMQCSEYISAHGYNTVTAANTAIAAQTVSEQSDVGLAAIASAETAELYGLRILDHDINEKTFNTTRFAVFCRSQAEPVSKDDNFILIFTLNNVVGALAKAVNIISAHGFDMRVLRSRPVKDVPWQYYFYVEAKGDQAGEEGQRMKRELAVCCETLKVVGHFPDDRDLSKKV